MASSSSTKAPCGTCDCKSLGILKCEGCSQIFCRKHVNEHRDMLSHQLDEIVLEHDTIQQMITEQNDQENNHHSLLDKIDKWEKDSIVKIQQTAEEVRQQVKTLIASQKETVSKQLQNLAKQLRKARDDDDYVETDLRTWTTMLEKLTHDVNTHSSLITICEDPSKILIKKISISSMTQQRCEDERFGESHGPIRIKNNGYVAKHCILKNDTAFVRGIGEYSSGKYKIRFVINKSTTEWFILFGIISKQMGLPLLFQRSEYSAFGWWSNDDTYPDNSRPSTRKNVRDLEGEKTLEIELLLDCNNQTISYFNERTKTMRELNIDTKRCPFPWQLVFNLYNGGDKIRLISSCENVVNIYF